jgi:hypothetical protein
MYLSSLGSYTCGIAAGTKKYAQILECNTLIEKYTRSTLCYGDRAPQTTDNES